MNRSTTMLVCACVLLPCTQVFATSWDTVIFRHDFDTSVEGMPDPDVWVINHPGVWWWTQGRTHFPNPEPWLPNGEFPRVQDGVCIIEHHLYNRYDLGNPNQWFLGGEIHTHMPFEPTRPYRFEARVKCYSDSCSSDPCVSYPNGLVTSFFTYGYDGSNSDEIDFEYLSNLTNDDSNYPDGDPVLTNTWNDSHQCPEYVETDGLDLAEWNTFRIYWYPGLRRVVWTWLDPNNGETWLRTETADSCVPDERMHLYFNFWAPDAGWPEAFDADLQPVNDLDQNEICGYEIDYVEVRVSTPHAVVAVGPLGPIDERPAPAP